MKNVFKLTLGVKIGAFCLLVLMLSFFDQNVNRWVNQHQNQLFLPVFNVLTFYGRPKFMLWFCPLLFGIGRIKHWPHCERAAVRIVLSVVISGLLVFVAKPLFGRKEPFTAKLALREEQTHHSTWLKRRWGRFPSGDSAVAWSTSTALASEFPVIAIPLYMLAFLTSLGRVVREAHFLSDVVAGAGLGYICARWLAKRALSSTRTSTRKR